MGLPWWLSGKQFACQAGNTEDRSLIPGLERFRVFLLGRSHEQRSLRRYGPWGRKESDMTEATKHAQALSGTVITYSSHEITAVGYVRFRRCQYIYPKKSQQSWQLQILCRHYIFEWKPEKDILGNIL